MVFGWENSLGWFAFLSLIPFIILYIVKPRPQELEVPSLMFFMRSKTHHAKQSFFKRLLANWLFLLQLLILLLLCLYFIEPYTTLGGTSFTDHSILIVDISASTQVGNVFEDIIKEAKNNLGKKNTILLISNTPRTGVKEVNKRDAEKYLNRLRATDGRSTIGEAILLAEKHILSDKDKITVISDFKTTSTLDVVAAKEGLMHKGVPVVFIPIQGKNVENVGITSLTVGKVESTVTITNFNGEAAKIPLNIGETNVEVVVDAKSSASHTFLTPAEATILSLKNNDAFMADNTAYLVLPKEKQVRVLVLTDTPSLYLTTALSSSPTISHDVTNSESFIDGYDVYIVAGVRELNKKVVAKLEESVAKGANVIIHVQEESLGFDYGDLLPFTFESVKGQTAVSIEHITKFTKDITFGSVDRHYALSSTEGVVIATAGETTLLSLHPSEQGTVVYYGILEKESEFKFSSSYPIFWTNLVKYLGQAEDIEDVNVPTGSILALPAEKTIKTPSGSITTDILVLEEKGIYSYEDKVYAASLVSNLESDLSANDVLSQAAASEAGESEALKYPLETLLIILICIFLFIELLAVKFRGEL